MFRQKERDKMKFWVQLSIVNSLMIISGTIQYCRFSNVLFNIFYFKKKYINSLNLVKVSDKDYDEKKLANERPL